MDLKPEMAMALFDTLKGLLELEIGLTNILTRWLNLFENIEKNFR